MNRLQYLLTKLAEEAGEVGQIVLKTQQFGLDEQCPGLTFTNKERCHQELNDLIAVVYMLNEEFNFDYWEDSAQVEAKKAKVNKYYNYSKSLGMVHD